LEEMLQQVEVEPAPSMENPKESVYQLPSVIGYDPVEVLKKYESCYDTLSVKKEQPSVLFSERLRPKPAWSTLNTREVIAPTVSQEVIMAESTLPTVPTVSIVSVETDVDNNEIMMTRTADAIMKVLGETLPKPKPQVIPEVQQPVVQPAPVSVTIESEVIEIESPTEFPPVPVPFVPRVFEQPRLVLDVPNDSETNPKRMKVNEEQSWPEFVFESPAKFEPETPMRRAAKAVSALDLPQFKF
jgi:hypothetical protein